MLSASLRLRLLLWRRLQLRPWSRESKGIVQLALMATERLPKDAKLTDQERLWRGARRIVESKKAGQLLAHILEVSDAEAWRLKTKLQEALDDD